MSRKPEPIYSPMAFWETVFADFRERTYKPEPPMLYDFQLALDTLRKRSSMTLEQLGPRLGVLPSVIAIHESRNGSSVRPELYNKLRRVALDYDLPKMAEWFAAQERKSARKTWRKNKDVIGKTDYEHES